MVSFKNTLLFAMAALSVSALPATPNTLETRDSSICNSGACPADRDQGATLDLLELVSTSDNGDYSLWSIRSVYMNNCKAVPVKDVRVPKASYTVDGKEQVITVDRQKGIAKWRENGKVTCYTLKERTDTKCPYTPRRTVWSGFLTKCKN